MSPQQPDIFTAVHRGIRKALSDLVVALGRAAPAPADSRRERALARDVVRFLHQHGANEDADLVPLLATRAPEAHRAMTRAHEAIDREIAGFEALIDDASSAALYVAAARLAAAYFEHMHVEELELEPVMRAVLSEDELREIGPRAVARTPEAHRESMIAFVVGASPPGLAELYLAKLPPPLARSVRARLA